MVEVNSFNYEFVQTNSEFLLFLKDMNKEINEELQEVQEEIHKEFQVERMVLFSDAVFAIVITLMAIEIKVPEFEGHETTKEIAKRLLHILPLFIAYLVSFLFIGLTWFRHLRMFSFVKDYNKKLVASNLLLLFFVSLFPFCVGMVTQPMIHNILPMVMYFSIIILCLLAQVNLGRQILYGDPSIRIQNEKVQDERKKHRDSLAGLYAFIITIALALLLYILIPQLEYKSLGWASLSVMPLIRIWIKKILNAKK